MICKDCRKRKYCSKPCREQKEYQQVVLNEAVASVMMKAITGGYRDRNTIHDRTEGA